MKAVYYERHGGAEVLEYGDLPDPALGPDSVLLRVRAAAVNPVDWKGREGYLEGLIDSRFPVVPGWDVAGVVERTGIAVTEYAPGDEVVGYVREDALARGTFAELVAANVRFLARKPPSLSWAEAAGLPLAGLAAYQSLVRVARVAAGETVLVHAAAGGVGSLAVQIAVSLGARVVGTASEHNHDFVRSLGAEPVTYGRGLDERVRALAPDGVDVLLDAVGKKALRTSKGLLKEGGRLVSVVETSVTDQGGTYVFARPDTTDLTALCELAATGRLTVPIAATFPLEKTAEAHRLSQEGHARGKIVVEVD
ncbi:NADP-dependent oxidoreductase [Streptomyces sp. NPDC001595]|uniref:NADP-dependent oxidoreductase n=1 Tax=Streptomyces sp. NPDC001532 TaxID=3154520 RepID=UPI003324F35D